MNADKPYYDRSDLQIMDKIITQIDNLPDKGKYEIVKGLLEKKIKSIFVLMGIKMILTMFVVVNVERT